MSPAETRPATTSSMGAGCGDVVVTVAKQLWRQWVDEGQLAGASSVRDTEYSFTIGRYAPRIAPGGRVYIVAFGRLRGYAPLIRLDRWGENQLALVRGGGAAAVTTDDEITGFQGWRYRWWPRETERPFPEWLTTEIPPRLRGIDRATMTPGSHSEILNAVEREDWTAVCAILRGHRFDAEGENEWADGALRAVAEKLTTLTRAKWEDKFAPFFVAVGAATSVETAPAEVVGADSVVPPFSEWTKGMALANLRDKAKRGQRLVPAYLSETCAEGNRTGYMVRLWEINVDGDGDLMRGLAAQSEAGADRLSALERKVGGRERLLELVNTNVWLVLWLVYSTGKRTGEPVDLAARFIELIENACALVAQGQPAP